MNETSLHYVYDPLCGWCYGAAPLLQAAAGISGLHIELHAGGLWLGERRQPMGQALRDYVRPHDERIQALTGQPFGEHYFNELLLRDGLLLGLGRALGETMAVTFVIGNANRMPTTLFSPGTSIASVLANEFGEAADLHFNTLFALGFLLFCITFVVLALAKWMIIRAEKAKGV